MKIAFVSTMNANLYQKYGEKFLFEFNKYASKSINLFIVFEGELPSNFIKLDKNILIEKFNTLEQKNFLRYYGNLEEAKGLRIKISEGKNNNKKIDLAFDFRFNAIRFSYKPFAIHQIVRSYSSAYDYIIWTDADLRCIKSFYEEDLIKFLPNENELLSYLGRRNKYSECGFLGFSVKNPFFNQFLDRVIEIYSSGEIFSLEQWHDSWVWDYVRLEFENKFDIKNKNISNDGFNSHHPFVKSGLEEFFDHLKGPERKKLGRSKPTDYN